MDVVQINEMLTTREGRERLRLRLQAALDAYDAVCATNSDAAGDGDTSVWHDNFAYEHNQREMHKWARRITDIRNILANVRVVEIPTDPTIARLGCVITLRDAYTKQKWNFEIAGYEDGNVSQGRVSYTTPLMKKIMGGQVGDEYELFLDDQNRTVVIVDIRPAKKTAGESHEC